MQVSLLLELVFLLYFNYFRTRVNPEPCFLLPDGWQAMEFVAQSNETLVRPAIQMDQGRFYVKSN